MANTGTSFIIIVINDLLPSCMTLYDSVLRFLRKSFACRCFFPKKHRTRILIMKIRVLSSYTMQSWSSSCSIPIRSIIPITASLSSGSAHQASPHPAEIALGTGISLPFTSCSLQAFSIAIASAVVWNVTTNLNSFFLMVQSQFQIQSPFLSP